jgi:DNA-binding HxlR family transcriptional regulator
MRRASTSQTCAVAKALDVIGDYWSLMVLREAFGGTTRFDAFQAKTGAASNVLSSRLQHLVEHGVLLKQPYQQAPERFEYVLTPRGRDLNDVVGALMRWGQRWLADAPCVEEGPHLDDKSA